MIALHRLRSFAKESPVNVFFFVSEIAKWKAQSLYEQLELDDRFVPTICIYPMLKELELHSSQISVLLEEKLSYFRNKNMNVINIWNIHKGCLKRSYFDSCGIIFYQQTWDSPPAPSPIHIAKKFLTFYIPYYLANNYSKELDLCMSLQRHVFGYIVPSEDIKEFYYKEVSKHKFAGRILGLGHTSTDCFHTIERTKKEFTAIYAPHFSFPCSTTQRLVYYSTFLENGEFMLEYAKKHQEIKWAFKPHPRLKSELEDTGIWTKEKINKYFKEWETIGEFCYSSDYQELFVNSDIMITDCGSFLTEYACTGNPIIRMVSPLLSLSPYPIVEELYSTYYCVKNNIELEKALNLLIIKKEDPQKAIRQKAVERVGLGKHSAAAKIKDYLSNLLRN